ncbi:hypothetical protein K2173_006337 [Erythroxylum novogranatense]|uniref:Cytochrome P450 n=1 Tax=Erythroxylum novogranatense TaxID=1862640 RepID=A0AAV8U315_9ROSI|nr:hypothetical protein K2173_006337 [Erythroxylum novogranatense]
MEILSVGVSIVLVAVVACGWRMVEWVWFRPRRVERFLRQQGLGGTQYRFLYGDWKTNTLMTQKAMSTPIDFSQDPSSRVIPFAHQTVQTYGKDCFMWVGPIPKVILISPEYIKDATMKIRECQKINANPMIKLLQSGLAQYDGHKWEKHKRIVTPAFHLEKLKLLVPAFHESSNMIISRWEKITSLEPEGSCEVDVWPHVQNLTSDAISRAAFGSSFEEGKKIFDLITEQVDYTSEAVQKIYIPGWRFLPTKNNRRMKAIDKEIQGLIGNIIISKREKERVVGRDNKQDLLGTLLESNRREIEENENKRSAGMSFEEVVEECKLFYLAGQETTSILLLWTMVLLAMHPTWQQRAREEAFQAFGDTDSPDFDGLNRLKVISMILYEVLRLYPPVSEFGRSVAEDVKIGDLTLPEGTLVFFPTILIHRNKEIWGDDSCEFKPERFSEGIAKATNSQLAYIPFGWGPRICIGQNFALTEVKLAITLILRSFSFQLSPSYSHAPRQVLTLRPQHGAPMIIRKLHAHKSID